MINQSGRTTSRTPPGATIDFQELPQPQAIRDRLPVAVVIGSGPSPTSEVQALLRKRLCFLGLLGTGGFALFVVFLVVPLFLGNPDTAPGYNSTIARETCLLALFASFTGLLWSWWPLSMGQLRLIEGLVFGLVLADTASGRYEDLAQFGLAQVLVEGPPIAPPRYAAFYCLPFFALIVAYGTFIPNTWRRATLVMGAMALLPFALALAAAVTEKMFSLQLVKALLIPVALSMGVSVALAVYGSHKIAVLRHEVNIARRIGQYQLIRRLGMGGMGEVYLAEHALLRRPCVIKLIRPDRAQDLNSISRFEREVQATATLTNWHTVEIFDYGHTKDGTFYYVMEYLSGLDLEQLVKQRGPLPVERVIHLLRQMCSALREAHAIGLIHRDIKPGNIITGERGGLPDVAKLLDFGLVQVQSINSDGENLTRDGAITGTPAYMSPEQAAGKKELNAMSDLYSLGAVGYFLLTGQPPFVRETAIQVIAAHLCEPVVAPDHLRPELPAQLQTIILKCLEKDPHNRFRSADHLNKALEQCERNGPLDAASDASQPTP
jgi:serine/threonine-protein kinase